MGLICLARPPAPLAAIVNDALATLSENVFRAVFEDGAAVEPTRETASGYVAAGLLFGALGTSVEGADRVRPLILLVRESLTSKPFVGAGGYVESSHGAQVNRRPLLRTSTGIANVQDVRDTRPSRLKY